MLQEELSVPPSVRYAAFQRFPAKCKRYIAYLFTEATDAVFVHVFSLQQISSLQIYILTLQKVNYYD